MRSVACVVSRSYSLTTIVLSSMTSPMQRADPGHVDGPVVLHGGGPRRPPVDLALVLGLPARPARGQRARIETAPRHRLGQRVERELGRARQANVDREAADGVAREQRIVGDLDHRRLGPRRLQRREPRRVRLDDEDRVGLEQVRARVVAAEQRVIVREVQVGAVLVEDRHGQRLGQRHQRRHRLRIAPGRLGDDDRIARAGQHVHCALDVLGIGHRARRRRDARRIEVLDRAQVLGQHLAGQGEVDGPLGLAPRDGQRPVHDRLDLRSHAQLVVPLHELAHHGALIERLLGPVDVAVARARQAGLGDRRAAGGDQDRRVGAGGVDDAAQRIGGAHDHVDHDDLRPPGHHGVAVGHAHGGDLVRDRQGAGQDLALGGALGVRLDQRREVSARVAEEIFDAARGEHFQISLGGALDRHFLEHGSLLRGP